MHRLSFKTEMASIFFGLLITPVKSGKVTLKQKGSSKKYILALDNCPSVQQVRMPKKDYGIAIIPGHFFGSESRSVAAHQH